MTEAEKNERIKAVEEQMAKLQKELEDIPAHLFAILLFNEQLDMLKKLMKFKFCYDHSYAPDWGNQDEYKWFVHLYTPTGKYYVSSYTTWDRPSTVYFSSEEIAQKCADWLNAGCPGYSEE